MKNAITNLINRFVSFTIIVTMGVIVLGAAYGANEEFTELLEDNTIPLGVAFQIRDDLEIQPQIVQTEGTVSNYRVKIVFAPTVDELYKIQDGCMIPFKNDGKFGWLNENFEEVIPAEYESKYYNSTSPPEFNDGYAVVKRGDYLGVIDKIGNVIVPFEYDEIYNFRNGFAPVRKGEYAGNVDKFGNIVVPIEYLHTSHFFEGRAVVYKGAGQGEPWWNVLYGAVDETGKLVIPMVYTSFDSFLDGLAIAGKREGLKDNLGVIDRDGNVLIPFEYDKIERDGINIYTLKTIDDKNWYGFWTIENGKPAFICSHCVVDYNMNPSGYWVQSVRNYNGKWGFIDTLGNVIAPMIYEDAGYFSDGLACVKQAGKWGYINTSGEMVIPCEFDDDHYSSRLDFNNGYAVINKDGKFVVIDKTGTIAFPFPINGSELERLSCYGVAFTKNGIVYANGNVIADCSFLSVEPFTNGYAFFSELTSDSEVKYGVVSQSGEITARYLDFTPVYSNKSISWGQDMQLLTRTLMTSFSEGLAAMRLNDKWGYINPTGEIVIDFQFDTVVEDLVDYTYSSQYSENPGAEAFNNGLAKVHINGKWNIIDKQGNFLLDKLYDSIESISGNYYICRDDNGGIKILTKNGNDALCGEKGTIHDKNGSVILQNCDSIEHYFDNLFLYKQNGKVGVFAINEKSTQQHDGIGVYCNGNRIQFDQPPIMENDRVLVPMR